MTDKEAKAEAIRRGYRAGVTIDKSVFNYYSAQKEWILQSDHCSVYADGSIVWGSDFIFKDGIWARIVDANNTYEIY